MKTTAKGLEGPQLAASVYPSARSSLTATEDSAPVDAAPSGRRRGWLLGAGAAGVAGAAVLAMQKVAPSAPEESRLASRSTSTAEESSDAGGYQLTQHVLRYYETARS